MAKARDAFHLVF